MAAVRLPRLMPTSGPVLAFERHRRAAGRPDDLVMLAAHLGDVHGSAHAAELRHAGLAWLPHRAQAMCCPSFPANGGVDAVASSNSGRVPGNALISVGEARALLHGAAAARPRSTRTPTRGTS